MADFSVYRDGESHFVLRAETVAAQRWFDWNTVDASALEEKSIKLDYRHIAAIIEFIRSDGLTVEFAAIP